MEADQILQVFRIVSSHLRIKESLQNHDFSRRLGGASSLNDAEQLCVSKLQHHKPPRKPIWDCEKDYKHRRKTVQGNN